jgi:hypothetical protein
VFDMTRIPRQQALGACRHLTLVVLAAVLVVATGCAGSDGGDEQSAAEAWADDVCASVSDWTDAVQDAQTTLRDPANLSANEVTGTLKSVSTATSAFVSDLKSFGPPDTDAGQAAQAQLSTLSDQLQEQADIVTGALNQSSGNLQQLLAQVSTVSGAVASMVSDAVAAVENIRQLDGADELERAFQDSATCEELRAGQAPDGG